MLNEIYKEITKYFQETPHIEINKINNKRIFKLSINRNIPLVAFIVELPLANKASALWHKNNRFDLAATCDGEYKKKKFQWSILIHWNT